MASHGIKDRVAIIGMGCTRFAEHWDNGADQLLVEAANEAFASAGVDQGDRRRLLGGHGRSGMSGMMLAKPLELSGKPVVRVENMCATGAEALRQAAYAVACGAYDVAMAMRRGEGQGLRVPGTQRRPHPQRRHRPDATAAAMFSMVVPAYAHKYGGRGGPDEARCWPASPRRTTPTARCNPRAQFRKPMSVESITRHAARGRQAQRLRLRRRRRRRRPPPSWCGPRTPTATPTRPSTSRRCRWWPATAQALIDPDYDYTTFPEIVALRPGRLRPGRHHRSPRGAGHGRGPRLLHPDRARPDGGPRVRRAGHGLEGGAGRRLRPGRRPPDQPRRRAQELRPPGRRQRPAHDVRVPGSSCAARRRRSARSTSPAAWPSPTTSGGYPGEMVSFVSILGAEQG